METTLLIFIVATLVNVFLAINLYGKLNTVKDMIDSLEELDDRIDEIEDYVEGIELRNLYSGDEDGVDCELLEKRVQTLENNVVQNIGEISNLQATVANQNQYIAEVAAFADRVNARIDGLSNDRPESF
jgi:uncharacterized coiled-coil protein SlyX